MRAYCGHTGGPIVEESRGKSICRQIRMIVLSQRTISKSGLPLLKYSVCFRTHVTPDSHTDHCNGRPGRYIRPPDEVYGAQHFFLPSVGFEPLTFHQM